MVFRRLIVIFCLCFFSSSGFATLFDVQSFRIGPNPLIISKDTLRINYVATLPHVSQYYLFTTTGELVFSKTYPNNTPTISHAGQCQFELINAANIQSLAPQLYILYMVLTAENHDIKKKQYVIFK